MSDVVEDREFFERVSRALVAYGTISEQAAGEARQMVDSKGVEFEHALYQTARFDEPAYRRVLQEVSGCLTLDPSQVTIDRDFIEAILAILPIDVIVGLKVFPVSLGPNELTVAMANPTRVGLISDLQATTSLRIHPVVTTYRGIQQAIEQNYAPLLREALHRIAGRRPDQILESVFARKTARDFQACYAEYLALVNRELVNAREDEAKTRQLLLHPGVISFAQTLLTDAIRRNCSDIHLEPSLADYRVRARINGVLTTLHHIERAAGQVLVMRLKDMARMEPDEVTSPADGQISYSPVFGRSLEFRVSVLPTIAGNKMVLRLLEKKNQKVALDRIGLAADDYEKVRRHVQAPNGLVLVTGPTGSGKTSTLYSILSLLNDEHSCIVTAEEPVESEIPGIVQVNCGVDCSFATALRSFLRQDPDVIMIGEVRDQETADIALRAALTGHLVLSTLHTNDAPTAVMRLLNLGCDPFVVAASTRLVIAQRLVRLLCPACKKPLDDPAGVASAFLGASPDSSNIFAAAGCDACQGTGYAGRTGVYEILEKSDALTDAINRRAPLGEVREIAASSGMRTLRERALELCARGLTTIDEVVRVTAE